MSVLRKCLEFVSLRIHVFILIKPQGRPPSVHRPAVVWASKGWSVRGWGCWEVEMPLRAEAYREVPGPQEHALEGSPGTPALFPGPSWQWAETLRLWAHIRVSSCWLGTLAACLDEKLASTAFGSQPGLCGDL